MLLQFSVQNFLSFKEEKILSLEPSSDKEHPENIFTIEGFKGLDVIAIYGANASGKTNLFRAITSSLLMLRHSPEMQVGQTLPVAPFKMDNESHNRPSVFEYQFLASDHKKYVYGFKVYPDRVEEEYLYCYHTNHPTKVFDRTNGDQYSFSRIYKKELEPLVGRNTCNKLFLSTATLWNAQATRTPFEWLNGQIDSYTNMRNFAGSSLAKYSEENRFNRRDDIDFAIRLLKNADINISNIQFQKRNDRNNEVADHAQIDDYQIRLIHTTRDEKDAENTYSFSLTEESAGTEILFFLAPLLKETLDSGRVLVVDEIDKSLHPYIVSYLIDLFRNREINKNGAQLIVTTHDTSQLTLNRFRRDQIYFTEKNPDTGISDLYALDDFELPVRKTENVSKRYLQGRYGAIPYVHAEDVS